VSGHSQLTADEWLKTFRKPPPGRHRRRSCSLPASSARRADCSAVLRSPGGRCAAGTAAVTLAVLAATPLAPRGLGPRTARVTATGRPLSVPPGSWTRHRAHSRGMRRRALPGGLCHRARPGGMRHWAREESSLLRWGPLARGYRAYSVVTSHPSSVTMRVCSA
jgi:hypothetical protein